ncbi:MAG: hypothetical protein AAFY78_08005 [Cyanobacteria bacterium J06648_16]
MTTALSTLSFTRGADSFEVPDAVITTGNIVNTLSGDDTLIGNRVDSGAGLFIEAESRLQTSTGNDVVAGQSQSNIGLENLGFINTGSGQDQVSALRITGGIPGPISLINRTAAVMALGSGQDSLTAAGVLRNEGGIDLGTGDDNISVTTFSIGANLPPFSSPLINSGWMQLGRGNDTVSTITFENSGLIRAGKGDDRIEALNRSSKGSNRFNNGGAILMEAGNDIIEGRGASMGLNNTGTVNMGAGNDLIIGEGVRPFMAPSFITQGVLNEGDLKLGSGHDRIDVKGAQFALRNTGSIDAGKGDDEILGISDPTISVPSGVRAGIGIDNKGEINLGAGRDRLTGQLILNQGEIDMGKGDDIVTADTFEGYGSLLLGKGNDQVMGFGDQWVDGGKGYDIAELGIDPGDVTEIVLGASPRALTTVTAHGMSMEFVNVEAFSFAGTAPIPFDQLADSLPVV